MWKYSITLSISCACSLVAAQSGTAPPGYYPPTYSGSIFTGTLEAVDAETQEITLTYSKGKKSERFVGRMESSCSWKEKGGPVHTFSASDIPKDTILTAFYSTFTTNSGQQKAKENLVFAISYVEFNGKKIAADKRVVISCSKQTFTKFMFY